MANKRKRERRLSYLLSYDMNLIVAIVFLIIFGLIMIYSASYYTASMSEAYHYDPTFLLKSQAKYSVLGIVVMLIVANIDYHTWKYFAMPALAGSVILILLLLVPGLGVTVKGATRWLKIAGVQFQVAEPVKVAMIVFSATLIGKYANMLSDWKVLLRVMAPTMVVSLMILKISNNMSTAAIVLGIGFMMVFIVHPKYKPFVILAALGVILAAGVIYYTMHFADSESAFRITRIQAWLNPYAEEFESDTAYQSLQGIYAIGSGGLMGKGLGNSIQKLGRIPEPYNDMIFAIICEELGIFGAGLVILLFMYLLYRLYSITQTAEDLFGRLLCVGVFAHVALQIVLNLMVVTRLFPTTGVTLPFFSSGGTATVFLLIEIGMVLNVEKWGRFKREQEAREVRLQ